MKEATGGAASTAAWEAASANMKGEELLSRAAAPRSGGRGGVPGDCGTGGTGVEDIEPGGWLVDGAAAVAAGMGAAEAGGAGGAAGGVRRRLLGGSVRCIAAM